mmetsp:Transcript_6661/g.5780  ORF Transcript_6661/g.5780 Transcript_6661/m.5780 type:complete len:83 (+) Transcript_6661:1791-2039(+)
MHVNWEIIKAAILSEEEKIKEMAENPQTEVEGSFKNSSHVETDKVVKHQQRKAVMVSGGISTELVKKSVDTRKRLVGLEGLI